MEDNSRLSAEDCADRIASLRKQVSSALRELVSGRSANCPMEAVEFALCGNGKRFRPVLLLLTAEAFGVPTEKALGAAVAVEILHTFTLVHDDIIDGAVQRRGHPTVRHRWDTETALLCGDYLMSLSFYVLSQSRDTVAMEIFFQTCEQLYVGQMSERALLQKENVSLKEYFRMVDRKTCALLQASLEIGGVLGGASSVERVQLREIGRRLGRAFQVQDDILDLTAEDANWGKCVGGDLLSGKRTFPLLLALRRSSTFEVPDSVAEVCERMSQLRVFEDAQKYIRQSTQRAQLQLARLFPESGTRVIGWLLEQMQRRSY